MGKDLNSLMELVREAVAPATDLEDAVFDIIESELEGCDFEYVRSYFEDGVSCESGSVGSLVYYYQTEAFFKEHFNEILELVQADAEELGSVPFELTANNMTWFAYEKLVCEFEGRIDWDELEETA